MTPLDTYTYLHYNLNLEKVELNDKIFNVLYMPIYTAIREQIGVNIETTLKRQ